MSLNYGDKISIKAELNIEILGIFPAGEQRDGKAKYLATLNGYKMTIDQDFVEGLKAFEIKEVKKNGKRK